MRKQTLQSCQQNLFELETINRMPKEVERRKTDDGYVFDLVDALSAPILTFSQLWADVIPERVLNIIPISRMIALRKAEQLATYEECVVYIYTRSLEAPMDSEWTDIYTHITCKTCEDWFQEDHWDVVKAPRELTDWLHSKLNNLRHHIYNKRRDILKKRLRDEERPKEQLQHNEKSLKTVENKNNVYPKQKSLF